MALSDDFKNALASWASGVTIVTTKVEGKWYGLTASSFSSLSLNPPLVLVCINNTNRLPAMMQLSKRFAISILAREQATISSDHAKPGREPMFELDDGIAEWNDSGIPHFKNSAATLDCEVHELIVHGDHTIAIGRVVAAQADPAKQPLIYYRRAYRTVTG